MKYFWQYMIKKGHAQEEWVKKIIKGFYDNGTMIGEIIMEKIYFKETELIGYMIKYLIEKKVVFNINNYYHRNGIDKVYNFLKRKIIKIK